MRSASAKQPFSPVIPILGSCAVGSTAGAIYTCCPSCEILSETRTCKQPWSPHGHHPYGVASLSWTGELETKVELV